MKLNKNAEANDTAIIIFIVAFQVFVIFALGLLNIDPETQEVGVELFGFSQNIITNIDALGWANVLIFSPLIAAIGYIVAKLIRGGG